MYKEWLLVPTGKYERDCRHFEKKHPAELLAALRNLSAYIKALTEAGNPLQVKAGFIHDEPNGIKAIDQKGGKGKLRQTRLYIYPHVEAGRVYLLGIGDKSRQRADIVTCCEFVNHITSEPKGD